MRKTTAVLALLTALIIGAPAQNAFRNFNINPPDSVNLSANQTALRNQGGRRTCITFAAIAALEAAYKKAGYGDLNLSEQFLNHMGKNFWLDVPWDTVLHRGADGAENQVSAFGGGQAWSYIEELASGLKVPEEQYMPYVGRNYGPQDFPALSHAWNDAAYWKTEITHSDFNLNNKFLPEAALTADKYYSVLDYGELGGKDIPSMEGILASGLELTWDCMIRIQPGTQSGIWQPCTGCQGAGHAMLLIGYVHRSTDNTKNYFLVKNSAGHTSFPGGYEHVSYAYVLANGLKCAYIRNINPPARWKELGFVGRWHLDFDGHRGVLDIYHVPHIDDHFFSQHNVHVNDLRIGSFYENGKAYKVNGSMRGNTIDFYIDADNPDVRWEVLGGKHFTYSLLYDKAPVMAGIQVDPDGSLYGGVATLASLPAAITPRPDLNPFGHGEWSIELGHESGKLQIESSIVAAPSAAGLVTSDYETHTVTLQLPSGTHTGYGMVEKKNRNYMLLIIPDLFGAFHPNAGYVSIYLFNFEKGTAAGTAVYQDGSMGGVVLHTGGLL